MQFPADAASDGRGHELERRWEALLGKAPRLRPWLAELLTRQRRLLAERAATDPDRQLWAQLAQLLHELEALPQFAVRAIATTLHDEDDERGTAAGDDAAESSLASADSPERAVSDLETLLADPAFALAFHCCETRIVPMLQPPDDLLHVPRAAWLGLLHACAPQRPVLSAEAAVALVLRAQSADFARLPAPARSAALRLFCATRADLEAGAPSGRLLTLLPAEWRLSAASLPGLVAVSTRGRVALSDASALCSRLVASVLASAQGRSAPRLGGLAHLQENGAGRAAPEEVAALARTARLHPRMAGLQQLLVLL